MKRLLLTILALLSIELRGQTWQELDSLAVMNTEQQNLDSAYVYANQAIELYKEQHGESDTVYANLLANLFLSLFYLGRYDEAMACLLEEKKVREGLGEKENYSYSRLMNDLGVMYQIFGNYDEAKNCFEVCLELTKSILGEQDPNFGYLCTNLAGFYFAIGNWKRSEDLFLKSMEVKRLTIGEMHEEYALGLNNLAVLYRSMGKYKLSETLLLEALNIYENTIGKDHPEYAKSLGNMGLLYGDLGSYNKAIQLTERNIKITQKAFGVNPDVTTSMNNLASYHSKLGNQSEAERIRLEVLELDKLFFGENHETYAFNLGNLGATYQRMGQLETAERFFIEAMEVDSAIFGEKHPSYLMDIHNLSVTYSKMKKYDKAISYGTEALEIREEVLGKNHQDYLKSLSHLAKIFYVLDSMDQADFPMRESIDILNNLKFQNFSFLSDEEKEAYHHQIRGYYDLYNSFAAKRFRSNPDIAEDVFNSNLRNKALLLKSNQVLRKSVLSSDDNELTEMYDTWVGLKSDLARLYSLPVDERTKKPTALEDQANSIEKQLIRRSQFFNDFINNQAYTWMDVRKKLKKNEAAVDIIRVRYISDIETDSVFYMALIVTSETRLYPRIVVMQKSTEFETKHIRDYHDFIVRSQFDEYNILGETACYEAFWMEIESEITDKEVVYFSPDGIYNKINLNTLVSPNGYFLCEEKKIILLNSLSELIEAVYIPPGGNGLAMIVGNPYFGLLSFDELQPEKSNEELLITHDLVGLYRGIDVKKLSNLPGSQHEAEMIDHLLRNNDWQTICLTGKQATEENFKQGGPFQVIHLATHGFFTEDPYSQERTSTFQHRDHYSEYRSAVNPMLRSGLMFSGSQNTLAGGFDHNFQIEDGILNAFEILYTDLSETELVVLSACETGLGDIMNGEGVFGLQRAFKIAGAKNIIMSLWKVDDNATQLLMSRFYELWLKGASKREAFLEAQDYMRTQTDFKSPYYWGGFIFLGNDDLVKKDSFQYAWILLIVIPLLLVLFLRKIKMG